METPKRNADAVNVTYRDERPVNPGEIQYCCIVNTDQICGMTFCCPCGCGDVSYLAFANNEYSTEPCWQWNGEEEAITLKPSILRTVECKWHGWLTDGVFVEC